MVLSSYEQYQNFYNSNQFEEALKKIDFIRDKCPDCSLYVTQHVELLLKTGKIDKARKEMQDGHIEDPYLKSLLEFYDQKSDLAKRIISQNSSSGDQKLFHLKQIIVKSEELKQKGNDALKAKKYEEAIKYYEAAVALDAGNHIYNSIIYSNLGLVYMKQNNLNKALVNMNKSIENNKNYFKAYLRRGEIYSQQKNYDAAIKDYNKVKEIDPSQDTTSFINAALEKQKKKEKKDYYALLGVDKKSTAEDIKKAYKKLALKWHPDRHRNKPEHEQEEAKNMFKDINEAFSTLSDPKKKQMYDLGGSDDMFQGGGMPGNFNPNDIFSAFFGDKSNQDNEFQSNFPGFGSMFGGGGMGGFDNMFAGMQGGGGGGRRQRGQGGFPGGMFFQNMGGQGMGGFPDMSQMFANMQQQQQKR